MIRLDMLLPRQLLPNELHSASCRKHAYVTTSPSANMRQTGCFARWQWLRQARLRCRQGWQFRPIWQSYEARCYVCPDP